ncbi:hypothetical protein FKW77_006520 [Venturia effusa]|uniref:ATP synthase mitochondrial F1 complex assembly factor 1 n=1 Tax=Venturia effusa TaxID=50376 RepID=A0A517LAZ8_9PEZI|nr:hypothetical protein FKW77_006520 [Venturia effusa]
MSSSRNTLLRRISSRPPAVYRPLQRRWARVHDVRCLATHGNGDRIADRYRDKLDRKAREKGLKDISDLKEAYKDQITKLRNQAIVAGATGPLNLPGTPEDLPPSAFPPGPPPAPAQPSTSRSTKAQTDVPPGIKTLSSYLDVDKIRELPHTEVEMLWRLRHAHKPQSLHFIIPAEAYAHIALNAQKHPQFILPLPREGQGAEIHFLQWTFPHPDVVNILFTHLAEYKLRGEYASPHTTVSLHTELVKDKGMVLGQGVVVEKRGITVDEAKWLMICLQKFYGAKGTLGGKDKPKQLLEQFSSGDERFKVEELLEEAERLG